MILTWAREPSSSSYLLHSLNTFLHETNWAVLDLDMFQKFKSRGHIFKGKRVKAFILGYTVTIIANQSPCAVMGTGQALCGKSRWGDQFPCSHESRIRVQFTVFWIYSRLTSFFTKTCLICTKLKPVKYDEFIPLYNGSHHKYILTFPFPTILVTGRCQLHIMFVHCLIPDISINLRQLKLHSYHIYKKLYDHNYYLQLELTKPSYFFWSSLFCNVQWSFRVSHPPLCHHQSI